MKQIDEFAITAHQLTKTYPQRRMLRGWRKTQSLHTAVDRVDLRVPAGKVFGLLGLNGAGKSTLVRMLCGLLLPTDGAATVLGYDVRRDSRPIRACVGLASGEERSFSWRLSARRNLLFFAELHGLSGTVACSRADALLNMLGLSSAGERPVGSFSSGMRQKLALARALLHKPPLLFLDEPTRGLDLLASEDLLSLIEHELVAQHGTTVFLTTHQMSEAERLCSTVAIIDKGRIRAVGAPTQLYDNLGLTTRYTITLAGPICSLPDTLHTIAPDIAVTEQGSSSTLTFRDCNGALGAVLGHIASAEMTIRAIDATPPTLEDVFRHYTTGTTG